jgi:hypothetical protein
MLGRKICLSYGGVQIFRIVNENLLHWVELILRFDCFVRENNVKILGSLPCKREVLSICFSFLIKYNKNVIFFYA